MTTQKFKLIFSQRSTVLNIIFIPPIVLRVSLHSQAWSSLESLKSKFYSRVESSTMQQQKVKKKIK